MSISDDGRGVDWAAIARRAEALGLPHGTRQQLEEALFADGVSSRAEVTHTSGRGVGLGAVRAVVRQLGGSIEVATELGQGTTFRFVFPEALLFDEIASIRPEAAGSGATAGASHGLSSARIAAAGLSKLD